MNAEANRCAKMQDKLFKHSKIIDTVFRPNAKNKLVTNEIIKTQKIKFLKITMLASIYNNNTYLGFCNNCPDMCGLNVA
jgi:hypothetical protein